MAKEYSVEKIFLSQVGEQIKEYRKKRGLTLQALGEDIGLDKGNTQRLENGKNMTLVTLFKIAAILEIEPKELLNFQTNYKIQDVEKFIAQKKRRK